MKKSKDKGLIHIADSGYAFEIDPQCVTLHKRRITKHGVAQFDCCGHFTSLEAMFQRLVNMDIAGLESLQDIATRQAELKNWIRATLKTCFVEISQAADKDKSIILISD